MNAIYAQVRLRLRAVSSEKLDCGWRVCIANSVVSAANEVLVESRAKFFKTRHLGFLIFVYDSGFKLTAFNFYESCKKRDFIVFIKILPNRIRKIVDIVTNFNFFRFAFKTRKRIAVPHVGVNKTSLAVLQRFIKERKSFAMRRIARIAF